MMQRCCAFALDTCQQLLHAVTNPTHHLVDIVLATSDKSERCGIGCIRVKLTLVDIDADADDRVPNPTPIKRTLDEHATNLTVSVIDVVGPLDSDGFTTQLAQPATASAAASLMQNCSRATMLAGL